MSSGPEQGELLVATPYCESATAFSTYHLIVNEACAWCRRPRKDLTVIYELRQAAQKDRA